MASPQTENGWTKIADEILEALAQTQMGGHEWRLVIGLLRKTYGFQKKADGISLTQWEKITGLGRRRVHVGLKRLEQRGIIIIVRDGTGRGHTSTYSFQKDYEQWNSTEKRTDKNSAEKRTNKPINSTQKRTRNSTQKRTHNREGKTERQSPPLAVGAYREIANRFPDKAVWNMVAETVGKNDEDLVFWKKVVTAWIGCGWNKLNVSGMMECYQRREIPGTKGGKRSGTHQRDDRRRGNLPPSETIDREMWDNAKCADRDDG